MLPRSLKMVVEEEAGGDPRDLPTMRRTGGKITKEKRPMRKARIVAGKRLEAHPEGEVILPPKG